MIKLIAKKSDRRKGVIAMAFTRKFLSALGIESDKIDEIITSHMEVVDGLKNKITTLEASANNNDDYKQKYDDAIKELNTLKESDYKTKYENEKKNFDAYKKDISAKETLSKKKLAYKKFLEDENIAEKAIDSILKISNFDDFEIDENGTIKDTTKLKEKVKEDYAGFVVEKQKSGVNTPKPPIGGNGSITSKADIFAKDEKGHYKLSTEERQKAISENPDLF